MLATEMLHRHHDELRALVRELERPALSAAKRRPVLDKLAAEMSLHEQIEDEIFYPAMADFSTLVTISHAEHRQLDDQVAAVLRFASDDVRFAEEFAALVAAFEHHAGLEETRMFPEVEAKLPEAVLTDLGRQLADRLEKLRSSPVTRARMRVKLATIRTL